jgi:hypothetical protein
MTAGAASLGESRSRQHRKICDEGIAAVVVNAVMMPNAGCFVAGMMLVQHRAYVPLPVFMPSRQYSTARVKTCIHHFDRPYRNASKSIRQGSV